MSEERDFKGVWIPKDLWLSKELKPMEKFFLLEIDSLDGVGGCFASNAHFSKLFDVSKGRCTQIIKKLEADGWLEVDVIRNGKIIVKRVVRVVNKLNNPSENIKQPSEKIKQPYLENDEGNNTNTNNTKEREKKESKPSLVIPDFINCDSWSEFEQHRKEIKKPLTDLARKKSFNILRNLSFDQQQAVIDYSITGRYSGLFTDRALNTQGKGNGSHQQFGNKESASEKNKRISRETTAQFRETIAAEVAAGVVPAV
ncbi:MAG: helix-turn-helix domain-containing protein [Methylococcales bacterium]|nr:helix-turn-helix domain-containing protein [Methylococcales bacterium]